MFSHLANYCCPIKRPKMLEWILEIHICSKELLLFASLLLWDESTAEVSGLFVCSISRFKIKCGNLNGNLCMKYVSKGKGSQYYMGSEISRSRHFLKKWLVNGNDVKEKRFYNERHFNLMWWKLQKRSSAILSMLLEIPLNSQHLARILMQKFGCDFAHLLKLDAWM